MSNHDVGSIFIDKSRDIVYTIVGVDYYKSDKGKVFSYTIHRTDTSVTDRINDWWLDIYAEKVC
jgi:hypothetical protein